MANKTLDYDKVFELVMQCRKSGLSDRQWCIDHDIIPSTFYYWVRKLQERACYAIPDSLSSSSRARSIPQKQDVVCVEIPKEPMLYEQAPFVAQQESSPIMLQFKDIQIAVSDDFNENTLKRVLLTLRETQC